MNEEIKKVCAMCSASRDERARELQADLAEAVRERDGLRATLVSAEKGRNQIDAAAVLACGKSSLPEGYTVRKNGWAFVSCHDGVVIRVCDTVSLAVRAAWEEATRLARDGLERRIKGLETEIEAVVLASGRAAMPEGYTVQRAHPGNGGVYASTIEGYGWRSKCVADDAAAVRLAWEHWAQGSAEAKPIGAAWLAALPDGYGLRYDESGRVAAHTDRGNGWVSLRVDSEAAAVRLAWQASFREARQDVAELLYKWETGKA